MKFLITYSHDIQYIRFLVTGTLTLYACVFSEAAVPQGWGQQTLAISIKEKLVTGGTGEVAVFHISFCLPFQNFPVLLVIVKASAKESCKHGFQQADTS